MEVSNNKFYLEKNYHKKIMIKKIMPKMLSTYSIFKRRIIILNIILKMVNTYNYS